MNDACAIGLDFGTESVRVLVVATADGRLLGQAAHAYARGVIDRTLPGRAESLPPDYALQHPGDWLASAAVAVRDALAAAKIPADRVIGLGVDFTSCTMLPCRGDGTPLCLVESFANVPLAWPKLWKHHGAKAETDHFNAVARQRREPWLARYGDAIGLEWFFPKVLETLRGAPQVYAAADVWVEGGDWFVWQLVDGPFPRCTAEKLVRSTCQAGYKACWNAEAGFPSRDFFATVDPAMADVADKLPGTLRPPGTAAGRLSEAAADLLGLPAGLAVSAATIDAHAGVPGAGVAGPDVMVLVMGTSSCHMLNATGEFLAPGIAGVVRGGILPGYFGYETGQAAVGDAFAWAAKLLGQSHADLNRLAAALPPGSGGVMAIDWLNGCRTPLMDGNLSGAFVGLTLGTRPEQLYRALMEATAFGVRWIRDILADAGVTVRGYVASGGLPGKSPLLMRIYTDVLNAPVPAAASDQAVALGAAILGSVAAGAKAGGHDDVAEAVRHMAPPAAAAESPDPTAAAAYDRLYAHYRRLCRPEGDLAAVMRALRELT